MKLTYLFTIVLLIMTAIIAGCLSPAPVITKNVTMNVTIVNTTVPTTIPTPNPTPTEIEIGSTPIDSGSVFGTNYTWFAYNTVTAYNGTTMTTSTKSTKTNTTFHGQPAVLIETIITTSSDSDVVNDEYWDTSLTTYLGGTSAANAQDQITNLPISPAVLTQKEIDSINEPGTLIYEGVNGVSVPAGYFPSANKFLKSDARGVGTIVWSDLSIPIPLQVQGYSMNDTYSMQLTGWG